MLTSSKAQTRNELHAESSRGQASTPAVSLARGFDARPAAERVTGLVRAVQKPFYTFPGFAKSLGKGSHRHAVETVVCTHLVLYRMYSGG